MKIVTISDTHKKIIEKLPKADLLIHSGDWSSRGSYEDSLRFINWMSSIRDDYKEIICVPGNHEKWIEANEDLAKEEFKEKGLTLLIDEQFIFEGVKIHGHPWTPIFFNWAYNATDDKRKNILKQVPNDIDIFVSHGPPYKILDQLDEYGSEPGAHVGCKELTNYIINSHNKPELFIFGHIHNQSGMLFEYGSMFVNAASVNEQYKLEQPYKVIYF